MKTTIQVYVTTRFIGHHRWMDAPPAVAFLRSFHRHVFHVKLTVNVTHSDRDVEFILLKRDLDSFIQMNYEGTQFEHSCEHIADRLIEVIKHQGYDVHSCEVSEDGENGAVVTVNPT